MEYMYDRRNVKRRKKLQEAGRRGGRQGVKLAACLGIFVVAFVLRLAAPEVSENVNAKIAQTLDHSVDYRAAFAAVGRFVSGESSFGEAVYAIKVSGEELAYSGNDAAAVSGVAREKLETMHLQYLEAKLRENSATQEKAEVQTAAQPEENTAEMPENVCAERLELPFDCASPSNGRKTSDFGYRQHPIDNEHKFHYGVDFAANEGDAILAFADGHVAASGISETAGKYLIISHGDGWTTQYFHCSEVYALGGSRVERGQVVAAAGQTGAATGPHLHFELLHDGDYLDPGLYLDEQE